MDGSGGNAWLPLEGMHAAASLFSLIVESELKGKGFQTFELCFTTSVGLELFSLSNLYSSWKFVSLVASASATTEDDADCLASVSGEHNKCYDYWFLI